MDRVHPHGLVVGFKLLDQVRDRRFVFPLAGADDGVELGLRIGRVESSAASKPPALAGGSAQATSIDTNVVINIPASMRMRTS